MSLVERKEIGDIGEYWIEKSWIVHLCIFPSSAFGQLPRIRFLNISVNTEGDDLIWEPFYAVCDSVKKRQSFKNRKNRSKYNFFKAKRGNNYCKTIRTLFVIYSDRSTEI